MWNKLTFPLPNFNDPDVKSYIMFDEEIKAPFKNSHVMCGVNWRTSHYVGMCDKSFKSYISVSVTISPRTNVLSYIMFVWCSQDEWANNTSAITCVSSVLLALWWWVLHSCLSSRIRHISPSVDRKSPYRNTCSWTRDLHNIFHGQNRW